MNDSGLCARHGRAFLQMQRITQVIADLQRNGINIGQARCSRDTYLAIRDIVRASTLAHGPMSAASGPIEAIMVAMPVIPVPLQMDDTLPYFTLALDDQDWHGMSRERARLNIAALA